MAKRIPAHIRKMAETLVQRGVINATALNGKLSVLSLAAGFLHRAEENGINPQAIVRHAIAYRKEHRGKLPDRNAFVNRIMGDMEIMSLNAESQKEIREGSVELANWMDMKARSDANRARFGRQARDNRIAEKTHKKTIGPGPRKR